MAKTKEKIIDRITNALSGLGGKYDKATANRHHDDYLHNYPDLIDSLYGTWLGGNVIDSIPEDMTKNGIMFSSNNDVIGIDDMYSAIEKYKLFEKLNEALVYARLYGGSCIFINLGEDFDATLDLKFVKKGDLINLSVFDRYELTPVIDEDPLSDSFREPVRYTRSSLEYPIDATRCIDFYGIKPSSRARYKCNGWGRSVFDRIHENIELYNSTQSLINSISAEGEVDVFKLSQMNNNNVSADKLKEIINVIVKAKSAFHAIVLGVDDSYERIPLSLGDLPMISDRALDHVASGSRIPKTRLLGEAPSGLNTDGNSSFRNYYDMIASKQSLISGKVTSILDVIFKSEFGFVPEYNWEWSPLWEMSQAELQTIRTQFASEVSSYRGLISKELILKEMQKRKMFDISDEYIEALSFVENEGNEEEENEEDINSEE